MRRDKPPNIDELGNLILLRQALDILAAREEVQLSLYPDGVEASTEIPALFDDAWKRVQPVFEPLLPAPARDALHAIDASLDERAPNWSGIREHARTARTALPGRPASPREWPNQLVRHETRLAIRSRVG